MTHAEFTMQWKRLIKQWGENTYSEERALVIWGEIGALSAFWLKKTVDQFIAECRQAPLLAEFREAASSERERERRIEKDRHRQEIDQFWSGSIFPDEERKTMFDAIKARMAGTFSDDNWKFFLSTLNNTVELKGCKKCENSGYVFTKNSRGSEFVWRCFCRAGDSRPRTYPVYGG